ncbi:MAG: SixA phosphatase family protein [Tepidiformaceae bacterium]
MHVCLVRHAIAVEPGTPGYENDDLRPLTERGRERMRQAATGLRTLFTPEAVLTSPLLRAKETAAILTAAYRLPPARPLAALASGDHDGLLADLTEIDASVVLCVGHEPHISELLSYLLTGKAECLAAPFRKGGAALVTCSDDTSAGTWTLTWMATPALLRAAARP